MIDYGIYTPLKSVGVSFNQNIVFMRFVIEFWRTKMVAKLNQAKVISSCKNIFFMSMIIFFLDQDFLNELLKLPFLRFVSMDMKGKRI